MIVSAYRLLPERAAPSTSVSPAATIFVTCRVFTELRRPEADRGRDYSGGDRGRKSLNPRDIGARRRALGAVRFMASSRAAIGLFPIREQCIFFSMRVIARNVLVSFWGRHPETKVSLERWYKLVRSAHWASTDEVQAAAPKAKVLNRERVRFEVAGGNYRLVVAFDFRRQIAFVKFIGSHAQYDKIDALTVSQY